MGRTVFDSPSSILKRCNGCEKLQALPLQYQTPVNWTEVAISEAHEEHGVVTDKKVLLLFCEDCTPHLDIAMLTLRDSLKPELEIETA